MRSLHYSPVATNHRAQPAAIASLLINNGRTLLVRSMDDLTKTADLEIAD
jgi:hypothetical protein